MGLQSLGEENCVLSFVMLSSSLLLLCFARSHVRIICDFDTLAFPEVMADVFLDKCADLDWSAIACPGGEAGQLMVLMSCLRIRLRGMADKLLQVACYSLKLSKP